MRTQFRALLVHGEESPAPGLQPFLEGEGIETSWVHSCAKAEAALACVERPALIFTDTVLTDGTWADVETLAEGVRPAVPVIVVSRFVDLPLYLDVLERGAADFIVPPFREADVACVVKGALLNRSRIPSGLSRATTGKRSEVTQNAQNHTCSRVGAAHAQAGR
jgi:DNA-binding NtrC family response regulator